MMRHTTAIALLIAGGLSLSLFLVKYQVQDLEDELETVNRAISTDIQAIHVLKAEWSHLNNPTRLRLLADRYLGLKPIEPEQLGTIERLPMRPDGGPMPEVVGGLDGKTKPALGEWIPGPSAKARAQLLTNTRAVP